MVASLSGDVDAAFADVVVTTIGDALDRGHWETLILEIGEVRTFGAAAVRAVLCLDDQCSARECRLEIRHPSPTTMRVLALFDLDDRVTSHTAPGDDIRSVGLIASGHFEEVVAQGVLNGRDALVLTTAELMAPGPVIVFVNRAFTDLFGYSADEMIGRTPRVLQGPLTDRSTLDRMKAHIARGDTYEDDLINYRSDGTPFVMSWKVMPVASHDGRADFCMSMQNDATLDRQRRRFDMANAVLDTQFLTGALDLSDPVVPVKQAMTTLLAVQTMMLGAGVATVVLTDRNDRDHRYSTATTDTDIRQVSAILETYERDPIDDAAIVVDGDAHLRIDSPTVSSSTYRSARFVLSGVHSDWLRLMNVDYHERLLRRVLGHNP